MTDLHDSWHKTPQSGDADSGCIDGARSVSSQCHGDRRYADVTLVDHSVWCHTHTSDANVWESSTVMYGAEKHRQGPRGHGRWMGMKLRHGRHRRKSPARPPGPVRASTARQRRRETVSNGSLVNGYGRGEHGRGRRHPSEQWSKELPVIHRGEW